MVDCEKEMSAEVLNRSHLVVSNRQRLKEHGHYSALGNEKTKCFINLPILTVPYMCNHSFLADFEEQIEVKINKFIHHFLVVFFGF